MVTVHSKLIWYFVAVNRNIWKGYGNDMTNKKSFWGGLLCGLVLAILVIVGLFTGKQLFRLIQYKVLGIETQATANASDKVVNDATTEKMKVIRDTIQEYYLEDIDQEELVNGIYSGMVSALEDPYSTYYSEEALEDIKQKTQGIYYGIGAYVGQDVSTKLPRISGVMPGTPAEESGLMAGDLIYQVNGEYVEGMDVSDVVFLIKGEEGTTVDLTLYREGEADFIELTAERKKIESPTVNHKMLEDGIGYIQIIEFDDVTTDQFAEALAACRAEKMSGLVLDLRDNPGGNLSTVTEIARMLLPKGLIVYTEDKAGERTEYTCDGEKEIDIPMVVLINGNSASASEILAGAIKDYQKGTLLGTTTYGKGIVQRIISLSDGSALKLTVSNYFTPNGNNIHKVGIEPDEELKLDVDNYVEKKIDNQLERAKEILKGK